VFIFLCEYGFHFIWLFVLFCNTFNCCICLRNLNLRCCCNAILTKHLNFYCILYNLCNFVFASCSFWKCCIFYITLMSTVVDGKNFLLHITHLGKEVITFFCRYHGFCHSRYMCSVFYSMAIIMEVCFLISDSS